jgi:hypothetical protein
MSSSGDVKTSGSGGAPEEGLRLKQSSSPAVEEQTAAANNNDPAAKPKKPNFIVAWLLDQKKTFSFPLLIMAIK